MNLSLRDGVILIARCDRAHYPWKWGAPPIRAATESQEGDPDTGLNMTESGIEIYPTALCVLENICSAEMAWDLAPEVERLILSRDINTKKKVSSIL
jgi:hypothetical protein